MPPPAPPPPRNPADEVEHWLRYIDCTLAHPHPLPSGTHVYQAALDAPAAIKDLYHCLYKLYTEEASSVNFREPVNALTLGVLNYYEVVKTPMSLRTVLDNIVRGECYHNAEEVMRDVELIWANCATFNGPSSLLAAEARKCAAALERLRKSYEDEQLAPQDAVDRVVGLIEAQSDQRVLDDLMQYFRREDPGMVEQRDLDLSLLKVKHLRAMQEIVDRYVHKRA